MRTTARTVRATTVSLLQATEFTGRRFAAELDLVGSIITDPGRGVPVAETVGVVPALFGEMDLRLIYCACDVLRDAPLIEVLKLARRALQAEGFWNPDGRADYTNCPCSWSNESLCGLAGSWPLSIAAIRWNAFRLVDLDQRQRRITSLQQQIVEALTGTKPAKLMIPPRREMRVA